VAILAGGLATRLLPLTGSMPKALVDVNGEPFIAHQLRLLAQSGIQRVVVCAGYLGDMIREVVGNGRAYDIDVAFSFDGPTLLGTAGALRKAEPLLGQAFFVLYGDSYLRCDYRDVQAAFEARGCLGLMTVFRNADAWDRSNVEFGDGGIVTYNKRTPTSRMRHIDYGLGVLDRRAIDLVPTDQPYDLAELYMQLVACGQLAAYEVHARFYEIGSVNGLEETRQWLAAARP
jgi:N-acetyl-alpha-D-muramate 1-phosphate uridylyltransferase